MLIYHVKSFFCSINVSCVLWCVFAVRTVWSSTLYSWWTCGPAACSSVRWQQLQEDCCTWSPDKYISKDTSSPPRKGHLSTYVLMTLVKYLFGDVHWVLSGLQVTRVLPDSGSLFHYGSAGYVWNTAWNTTQVLSRPLLKLSPPCVSNFQKVPKW